MTDESGVPVTAEHHEGPVRATGTDHVTIWGSNAENVLSFYRDLLGMRLVLRQPNLDDPSQTHLFLDTGDGRILTFFVNDDHPAHEEPQRTGVGAVHHVAFRVAPERFAEVAEALEEDGRGYNLFDRGVFLSFYTRDNDGLVVEITTDKYDVPDERRGDVLAEAQRLREEDGAEYAKKKHLEAALEELGLNAEPHDIEVDAPSGTSGV
jgi:catechol 2,3-dioxygenase-like lactoylglutathione lyase family enzyme